MGRAAFPITVTVLLAAVVCRFLFERVVAVYHPYQWDESFHVMQGIRIADDLRQGEFIAFLFDTYRQVYWPPLHSWYLGLVSLLFGSSLTAMRTSSLLALTLTAIFTSLAAWRALRFEDADETASAFGGIAGGAAVLVSAGLLLHATQAMIEVPGTALLALGFVLYQLTVSHPNRWTGLALGVGIAATYLMKSNYGVLLAASVAVGFIFDGAWWSAYKRWTEPLASIRRAHIWTAVGLGVPLIAWFAYLPKIDRSVRAMTNFPLGPDRFSPEGLLFYPNATVWLAGSWPWVLVWGLVVVLSFARLKNPTIRVAIVLVVLQAIAAQMAVTKVDRHIMPLVPAIAILFGYWAGIAWAWLPNIGRAIAVPVAVALLIWQGNIAVLSVDPATDPLSFAAGDIIEQLATEHPSSAFVIAKDSHLSPAAFDWGLIQKGLLTVDGSGSLVQDDEDRLVTMVASLLPGPLGDRVSAELAQWPARPRWTAYVGLPLDSPRAILPNNLLEAVGPLLQDSPVDSLFLVFRTPPIEFPGLTAETTMATPFPGFRYTETLSYPNLGVTVVRFGR